jgi:hypothetical protein
MEILTCLTTSIPSSIQNVVSFELYWESNMMDNPVVFFDITIGGSSKGRIEMELCTDVVIKSA